MSLYFFSSVCKDIPHCQSGKMLCRSSVDDSMCLRCDEHYYSTKVYGGGCLREFGLTVKLVYNTNMQA